MIQKRLVLCRKCSGGKNGAICKSKNSENQQPIVLFAPTFFENVPARRPKTAVFVAKMKNVTEITVSQDKAAFLLVSGVPLATVAANVGISARTLHRWLQLPVVQNRVRELRKVSLEHSSGKLQRLTDAAIVCLERNLTSGNRASEVRAAATILRLSSEAIEFFDFDSRLAKIEQNLDLK